MALLGVGAAIVLLLGSSTAAQVCGNGSVEPGEQCDPPGSACGAFLTCDAQCECHPPRDHFKCYRANAPGVPRMVTLTDEFLTTVSRVRKPSRFCNPVDKNGEGLADPTGHLMCHKIRDVVKIAPRDVMISNQFGDQTLRIRSAETLCNPAEKNGVQLSSVAGAFVDHFKCYKLQGRGFTPRTVTLSDQFTTVDSTVLRPSQLCSPVDKNGSGIKQPDNHLVCYKIKDATKFVGAGVTVADQFGTFQINARHGGCHKPLLLCVPSKKVCPTPDRQDGCAANQVCNANRRCQALADFCTDPTPPVRDKVKVCAEGDPAKLGNGCNADANCDGPGATVGNGRCRQGGHRGVQRPLEGGWDAINDLDSLKVCVGTSDPAKLGNPCNTDGACDGPIPLINNGMCRATCTLGDPAKTGNLCATDAECDGPAPKINNGMCGNFGTLGSLPLTTANDRVLLSNNHVFARNSGNVAGPAAAGEQVNQPHLQPPAAVAHLPAPLDAYEWMCRDAAAGACTTPDAWINLKNQNCLDSSIAVRDLSAGLVGGGILDVPGGPAAVPVVCVAGDPAKVGTPCGADANCDGPGPAAGNGRCGFRALCVAGANLGAACAADANCDTVPAAGDGRCRVLPAQCTAGDPAKVGTDCRTNGDCDGPGPAVGNGQCRPRCPANSNRLASLGMLVKKSGARTGLTCGKVTMTNDMFALGLPGGNATFVGQIEMEPVRTCIAGDPAKIGNVCNANAACDGPAPTVNNGVCRGGVNNNFTCKGDSGSLVMGVATNRPIGLFFADNDVAGCTIPAGGGVTQSDANPIDVVLGRFALHF